MQVWVSLKAHSLVARGGMLHELTPEEDELYWLSGAGTKVDQDIMLTPCWTVMTHCGTELVRFFGAGSSWLVGIWLACTGQKRAHLCCKRFMPWPQSVDDAARIVMVCTY